MNNIRSGILHLILFGCIGHLQSQQADTCKQGFVKHGSSCYMFSILQANWIQAMKLCSLYGGDLAIVESADEQLWIESYLKKTWNKVNQTDGIWLGGTDLLIENEWIWAKTGESFEYQRWGPNEPSYHQGNSNVDENCLELLPHKSFMWNDESCEHAKNFLCEAQLVIGQPIIVG